MLDYILFFFSTVWYTLGAVVICGLVVALCRRAFVYMLGGGAGRAVVIGTSILGTPIHEFSHALMCIVFGHKITKMTLWQPASSDGVMGYVSHSYNRKNPYHILGNLFIGIGPVLGGMGVLTLILFLCFPSALETYMSAAQDVVASGEGGVFRGFVLFWEGICLFPSMVGEAMTDSGVPVWARIIGVIALISISFHIELSPADIKGSLRSLPLYLALVLLFVVVCAIIGKDAMETVSGALSAFSAYMTTLFVIVIVMSVAQVVIALPIFLVRRLLSK